MSMAATSSHSTHTAREKARVPKSLVKTRHEKKADTMMVEAAQRTQEALQM